jgi:DNA-binding MarR family transcriptional regulator
VGRVLAGQPVAAARGKDALRLWLRLLASATLIEQHLRRKLRERFDVTLAQFDLMAELDRAGEPKTMSEISEMLMVSNGNVTGVADRLSQAGLLERLADPEDRRVYRLALTPLGRARFREMALAHEGWLAELLADLDGDALRGLQQHLKTLKDALKERSE